MDQRPIRQLRSVLDSTDYSSLESALASVREVLDGRRIWHVNSTPQGGGVAELLSTLLPYAADAGVDVRWLVIEGRDGVLRPHEAHPQPCSTRATTSTHRSPRIASRYEDGLVEERDEARRTIGRGDVVVLHDPQTAGLAPTLVEHGATVVWRCHVGIDAPGPLARGAWDLLREDVAAAHQSGVHRAELRVGRARSRPHLGHGAVHRRRVGQEPPAGGGRPPTRCSHRARSSTETATAGATRPRSSSATASACRSHAERGSSTTSAVPRMRRWWSRSRAGTA